MPEATPQPSPDWLTVRPQPQNSLAGSEMARAASRRLPQVSSDCRIDALFLELVAAEEAAGGVGDERHRHPFAVDLGDFFGVDAGHDVAVLGRRLPRPRRRRPRAGRAGSSAGWRRCWCRRNRADCPPSPPPTSCRGNRRRIRDWWSRCRARHRWRSRNWLTVSRNMFCAASKYSVRWMTVSLPALPTGSGASGLASSAKAGRPEPAIKSPAPVRAVPRNNSRRVKFLRSVTRLSSSKNSVIDHCRIDTRPRCRRNCRQHAPDYRCHAGLTGPPRPGAHLQYPTGTVGIADNNEPGIGRCPEGRAANSLSPMLPPPAARATEVILVW